MNGLVDARNHIYLAERAEYVGPPAEGIECDQVEWIALAKIVGLISSGQIVGRTTIAALLMAAQERRT